MSVSIEWQCPNCKLIVSAFVREYTDPRVCEFCGFVDQIKKPSKFGNRKVEVDGITFDSAAEAQRYRELKLLVATGDILNLEVHPTFELAPAQKYSTGQRTKPALRYEADFSYFDKEALQTVVEDVKGQETKEFRTKLHLFLNRYGNEYLFRLARVHSVRGGGFYFEFEDYEVR